MSSKAKIGSGTLAAMGRQGVKELRAALYPESNISREAEMGTYATLTPGEIADQRAEPETGTAHDRHSGGVLDERMSDLHRSQNIRESPQREQSVPERDAPDMERE